MNDSADEKIQRKYKKQHLRKIMILVGIDILRIGIGFGGMICFLFGAVPLWEKHMGNK